MGYPGGEHRHPPHREGVSRFLPLSLWRLFRFDSASTGSGSELLVPNQPCYLGRFWSLQEVEPRWKKWVTGPMWALEGYNGGRFLPCSLPRGLQWCEQHLSHFPSATNTPVPSCLLRHKGLNPSASTNQNKAFLSYVASVGDYGHSNVWITNSSLPFLLLSAVPAIYTREGGEEHGIKCEDRRQDVGLRR